MLAENLAVYLRAEFADKPQHWKPLVYCQRGGRGAGRLWKCCSVSARAVQLDGGYKTYRRAVVDGIKECAASVRWIVIIGKTGVGKTALLGELAKQGAAVLDLESLANHRGSVFGAMGAQPSQRRFESLLWNAMRQLPNAKNGVVFVESEGRKIGALHLPSALLSFMRNAAQAVLLSSPITERIGRIRRQYDNYIASEELFGAAVARIAAYTGDKRAEQWRQMHSAGDVSKLLGEMLQNFYDIGYEKSLRTNYSCADIIARAESVDDDMSMCAIAKTILAGFHNH